MVNDEALKEFLVESHEGLDRLDREFVALESDPTAPDRIGTIFRAIHTIKGTSGFLGLRRLETLTHAGESLLSLLRDGTATLNPEMTSALLEMVDRVRASLRSIEETGQESEDDCTDVIARLNASRARASVMDPSLKAPPLSAQPKQQAEPVKQESAAPVEPPAAPSAPVVAAPAAPPADEVAATEAAAPRRPSRPSLAQRGKSHAPKAPAPTAAPAPEASQGSAISDRNVRVDVGLLDKLMNLVGELVLARNQIVQFGARFEDPTFVGASQRLNLITTELQEHVMKTRMQPIGNIWSKLPRVVRDLAVACGKQVRVEMIGKDTELDRTILEAIKDPLTHMVRNSVDHGLEMPETRVARGKPKTGTLTLRAFHEGGQVNIEISDDGGGINHEAIRRKAIDKNLISAERAARLSEYELTQLIFLPGFSTAEKVTNISGRGVGMDVVKTNIERIGGTIDLTSKLGVGTSLKIRIPLTLAIVPALIVVSSGQRYAIPQTNLLELVRLEGDEARTQVELLHGVPVYRLRGQLLPLVYLNRALALPTDGSGKEQAINIIVLQADDRQLGLVVDEVRDTEEIVVKPLGTELKGLSVFAGATIMGDGCVALILDVVGLATHAGAISRGRDRSRISDEKKMAVLSNTNLDEKQALLLFSLGEDRTMALPLSMVARLEEFHGDRLERAGNASVVQYRDEILPLIDLAAAAGGYPSESGGSMPVIVYSQGSRSVGFVVGRILDVVEDFVRVEQCTAQPGVLGAAVIQGKVIDILDVDSVVRMNAPWFFEGAAA